MPPRLRDVGSGTDLAFVSRIPTWKPLTVDGSIPPELMKLYGEEYANASNEFWGPNGGKPSTT